MIANRSVQKGYLDLSLLVEVAPVVMKTKNCTLNFRLRRLPDESNSKYVQTKIQSYFPKNVVYSFYETISHNTELLNDPIRPRILRKNNTINKNLLRSLSGTRLDYKRRKVGKNLDYDGCHEDYTIHSKDHEVPDNVLSADKGKKRCNREERAILGFPLGLNNMV